MFYHHSVQGLNVNTGLNRVRGRQDSGQRGVGDFALTCILQLAMPAIVYLIVCRAGKSFQEKLEALAVVQAKEPAETLEKATKTQGTKSVVATAFLIPALDLDGLEFTEFLTLPTGSCAM